VYALPCPLRPIASATAPEEVFIGRLGATHLMVISGRPCLDGRQPSAGRPGLAQWATMFRLGPDAAFP